MLGSLHFLTALFWLLWKGNWKIPTIIYWLFFSIDASATEGHICQYVNDADKNKSNCIMKKVEVRGVARLCLFALKDILPGQELQYDYGDKRQRLWWRTKVGVWFYFVTYRGDWNWAGLRVSQGEVVARSLFVGDKTGLGGGIVWAVANLEHFPTDRPDFSKF